MCIVHIELVSPVQWLTEAGEYPQLPTQPKFFWSFSNLYSNLIWSFWVASRRKIKIWIWGKKVQSITEKGGLWGFLEVSGLKMQLSVINWTFFPQVQITIFLCEATQNDHIRLLYKFEKDKKKFGCVGSCGYAPASAKNRSQGWF